jgi:c-di-GMP-binding flagellar brake protein YcgR
MRQKHPNHQCGGRNGASVKTERRKHPRRLIPGKKMIVLDRCSEKVATLRDLSAGGMQLGYSPESAICHQWTFIDIFTEEGGRILIADLSCKTVYDIASLAENDRYRGTDVRTCGVRFERLTADQKVRLNQLLNGTATA